MKLNCVVAGKKEFGLNSIVSMLSQIEFVYISALPGNHEELISFFYNNPKPDLIFLDINLHGLEQPELKSVIALIPLVTITIKDRPFPLQDSKYCIIGQMYKPLSFEKLRVILNRASKLLFLKTPIPVQIPEPGFLKIKCRGILVEIAFADIVYIEAAGHFVFVHTTKEKHIASYTLKWLAAHLPIRQFVRVHKSYMVSRSYVEKITDSTVLAGNSTLPVGKKFKNLLYLHPG